MIYNLSEHKYETSYFNHNVIEYHFPGLPIPPLHTLFEFCQNMYNWLSLDHENVAVVHC